jgi:ABC-type branched-subunit amino acid transport system substrate-binding protein
VRRRKWVATSAVLAVVGAFASAGIAASGAPGAGAQSSVRGVTSNSISVAGLTQASQFTAAELKTGATARFQVENNKGGVFGRKINYVESADDQGDPTTDLTQAQRLVQQDQVFAVVPTLTPVVTQATQFFAQQKVPFIGWGIDHGFCNNNYALAFTGCIVPPPSIPTTGTTWGALIQSFYKAHGQGTTGKTAAIISEDNDTGKTGAVVIGSQAAKSGFKVVYQKSSLPATPPGDYSPYVNDLLTSNSGKAPDTIFVVTSVNNTLKLPGALTAAGFKGVLTNAVLYDPRAVGLMKANSVFTQFDLPVDTTNPAMQQIVANLQAVGGPSVSITQGMLASYFSADAFVAALKKTGKNLTPDAFAKAIANFTYQIPGVVGPTKYPASRTQGSPCGVLAYSDGTNWSIQTPYTCYQDYNYKTGKFLKY